MPRESKPSGEPSLLAVKRRLGVNEVTIKKRRTWRQVKQLVSNEYFELLPTDAPTFSSIEAPPSMLPAKKYCDITGFPAKYTDPKTKLRFCTPEAFRYARSLPEHKVEELLALRQAETRIK